jgi:hypothetical protein
MQFDDVSRNCEPKTRTSGVACFTAIHAIVPVEDVLQLITWMPRPVSATRTARRALSSGMDLHPDSAARPRMTHGVLDEILQHTFDHADVRVHLRMLNGKPT